MVVVTELSNIKQILDEISSAQNGDVNAGNSNEAKQC
jgi:hypothetical protein